MTTTPRNTSRKLFLAAALLVGGYGIAFVLGGLSELLLPTASSLSEPQAEGSWLTAFNGFVGRQEQATSAGSLVPQAEIGGNAVASTLTPMPRLDEPPTWLVATSSADSTKPASHPSFAAPPTIRENRPIEEADGGSRVAEFAQSGPKARITNVTAVTPQSNSREASPWDRWPRWNASDTADVNRPVAATFQDTSAATSRTMQTTYSDSEVVRKNSPPLDSGYTEERSGRTHVVVDGDSLTRLAERYLDDPAMGVEIYRLNRDVLDNPELLPIGVELRIPDDRMADSSAGFAFARSDATAKSSTPHGMVPVEWSPRAFNGSPRAELLQPIPAGRSD